ncbi:ABC transporter ATP-binding protein [Tahibacter sp.]|uniref:ABC transporter ATP-binding protein n=1 Tax=Tahibacter sp. TaxID=2056211 RepID=UPI0028C3BBC3|nr:ABC transporter ATP-binding protein [Tahibacter sp.]
MSSEVAIRVENVAKSFAIYERPYHRLLQQLFPNARRGWHREFHALRDVSFEVRRGDTVGIVGRNGSGKSTLLQLICGTMSPTSGRIEVNGRIAALLELGAGFNPEFTGRENVFLNGTVLGLSRDDIEGRFDAIAAFADIGDFIEQPVKSYSSGMYVRLAFAVAINVTPDILVVDEALSVGDEAFQRKCFARIQRMRDDGATVLFVSHGAGTVLELCNRAILLDRGDCLADGAPRQVISRYQQLLYAPAERQAELRDAIRNDVEIVVAPAAGDDSAAEAPDDAYLDPGLQSQSAVVYPSRGAQIIDPHIETLAGRRVNVLRPGGVFVYTFRVAFEQAAACVRFGMLIKTTTGVELAGGVSALAYDALPCVEAGQEFVAQFQFRCLLAPGTYFANAGVLGRDGETEQFLDRRVDVAMFRVMPDTARLATAYVDLDMRSTVHATAVPGNETYSG